MEYLGTQTLERDGFDLVPDLVSGDLRGELVGLFDSDPGVAGRRDGLEFEVVRRAVEAAGVVAVVRAVLGDGAFAVKAVLFDKTSASNWLVPWHQDVMVPVRERREVLGFDAWSKKGGIAHVRPPAEVLESMLTLRIDLDGSTATNGALRVIPGSHLGGILGAEAVQERQRGELPADCIVPPLGGLIMRPLLLHASSRATEPVNRRIVHLEFAADELPGGLKWFQRHSV
ncbi:MAG: phytanoyl-CoA dioxygenase family protein [Planctomycetes bacterium]|nr:phytanoyl-CoA dioxygenase family protein [Planctomycetota bacterium]